MAAERMAAGLVLGQRFAAGTPLPSPLLAGTARALRISADGRDRVVEVQLPAGAAIPRLRATGAVELFVQWGRLMRPLPKARGGGGAADAARHEADPQMRLRRGDYVRLAAGAGAGRWVAAEPTTVLLFLDGGATLARPPANATGTPDIEPVIVRNRDRRWQPGTVARDAGAPQVELWVKPLRLDPVTGARTFLVASAAGMTVPWERHSVAEEGYLVAGDYQLEECLATGLETITYQRGGYFYRPAGLVHSGPRSTSTAGAVWLIRTPATLDAVFSPTCDSPPARSVP